MTSPLFPPGGPGIGSQAIQQGDLATRLRRFTKGVGTLTTQLETTITPDMLLADLSRDPYQNEWNSYASPNLQSGAAGNFSILALVGNAPVTMVDAVSIVTAAAGNVVVVQTQRPETAGLGTTPTAANLAPLNNGGKGVNLLAICQAKIDNLNQAASPSGQAIENIVGTGATQLIVWPYPIVLYGPPYSGSNTNGDALVLSSFAANQAIRCTFYFREFLNIAPN